MTATIQAQLFDANGYNSGSVPTSRRPRNTDLIKTISYSQHEILGWIQNLYGIQRFDLDMTYSKGRFYRNGIRAPRFKTDIRPLHRDVIPANSRYLPFKANSFQSVIYAPPFFPCGGMGSNIRYKYGAYDSLEALWSSYQASMREAWRVLNPQGVFVFKCQDVLMGRQQFFVHSEVLRYGQEINFYASDLFVKLQRHVPISWNHQRQNNARKFHCYFLVFVKKIRPVRTITSSCRLKNASQKH